MADETQEQTGPDLPERLPSEEGLINEDEDEEGQIKESPPGAPSDEARVQDVAKPDDGEAKDNDHKSSKKHKHKDKEREHKKRKHSHKDKDREHKEKRHRHSKDEHDPNTSSKPPNGQEKDAARRDDRRDTHDRPQAGRASPRARDREPVSGRQAAGERNADRQQSDRDRPRESDGRRHAERDRDSTRASDRERGRDKARDRDRDRDKDRNRDHERPRNEDRARRGNADRAVDADRGASGRQDRELPKSDAQPGTSSRGAPEQPSHVQSIQPQPSHVGAVKKEPLSLEELVKRRKEAEEEAARPKFMTKKEREELALKKLHEKAQDVQRSQAILRAQTEEAYQRAERERREREEEERQNRISSREREQQLELIRQQYLGTERQKRRVAKASEKFRFNFDWDAKDDTSKDQNPLYDKLQGGTLLFGRGMIAGIDRREQLKVAARKEQSTLQSLRDSRGEETTVEEMRADAERAIRADKYDEDPVKNQKHWSDKSREEMTQRDWRIFREDHRISYKGQGKNAPDPYRSWGEMPLPDEIRRAISLLGYEKPSPIQMASIPFGLRNRDVVGLAETGSGKTAAFVIPMLVYIMGQPPMTEANCVDGPYAVVLAPTRELAQQIDEEATTLAKFTGFKSVCVVGGASYDEQAAKLRRGAEIVVATPGRLVDCLNRRYAVLNQCNYIVLDEADRMIDMGFEPQVMQVLDAMPSTNLKPEDEGVLLEADRVYRTTYMFSATMPDQVARIAKRYLRRAVTVTVGSAGRATDNVTQRVLWMTEKDKSWRLLHELELFQSTNKGEAMKVIIFVNNRNHSEEVYNALAATKKYKCANLHGGKTQEQREASIKGFREKEFDIMIATDVAGRGIDVRDIGLVINYDMPHTIENYTHRIGRTGRAGRKGTALTFLTTNNTEVFYDLKALLEESKATVPPELARHEAAKVKPGGFDQQSRKDTILYAKT